MFGIKKTPHFFKTIVTAYNSLLVSPLSVYKGILIILLMTIITKLLKAKRKDNWQTENIEKKLKRCNPHQCISAPVDIMVICLTPFILSASICTFELSIIVIIPTAHTGNQSYIVRNAPFGHIF